MLDAFLFFLLKPAIFLAFILPFTGSLTIYFLRQSKVFFYLGFLFVILVSLPLILPFKRIVLKDLKTLYSLPQEAFKEKDLAIGTELLIKEEGSWTRVYLPLSLKGWLKNE